MVAIIVEYFFEIFLSLDFSTKNLCKTVIQNAVELLLFEIIN